MKKPFTIMTLILGLLMGMIHLGEEAQAFRGRGSRPSHAAPSSKPTFTRPTYQHNHHYNQNSGSFSSHSSVTGAGGRSATSQTTGKFNAVSGQFNSQTVTTGPEGQSLTRTGSGDIDYRNQSVTTSGTVKTSGGRSATYDASAQYNDSTGTYDANASATTQQGYGGSVSASGSGSGDGTVTVESNNGRSYTFDGSRVESD